jgi:glycine betaine/proline transport system ATP-binding protein
MNPLNVLKGGTVMRRRAALRSEDGFLWLDGEGRYTVALDGQGSATAARHGAHALPILRLESFDPAGPALPPGIVLVPREMPLRMVVQLRQASGHPVLLEEAGALAGVCDDAEMLAALSGVARAGTARAAVPVA